MHIPDSMLQNAVCPVTAAVAAAGVLGASYFAVKAKDKPAASRFGAITALVFAGQMMNFPIMSGTSGHLLGGVLAASLLGVPFGVLSIALVVAIQSLVFADGGVTVLGANVLNMALLGAGVGGMFYVWLAKRSQSSAWRYAALGIASWVSVVLASLAVGIELAADGQTTLAKVLPAMLGVHALIGLGEAAITIAVCAMLADRKPSLAPRRSGVAIAMLAAVVVALVLSPFASAMPDGLEWVGENYGFLHDSAPAFVGVLPDYVVPALNNSFWATGLAGLAGVGICFAAGWIVSRAIKATTAKA